MKTCTKCKKEQPDSEFWKCATLKDGLHDWCKTCGKEYKKKHYYSHREEELELRKIYLREHMEERLKYRKRYVREHKKEIQERGRKRYQEHKEERSMQRKSPEYKENPFQLIEYRNHNGKIVFKLAMVFEDKPGKPIKIDPFGGMKMNFRYHKKENFKRYRNRVSKVSA